MIAEGAFTVFVIGMRHGADPDHLAAIDNLTRNSFRARPKFSRFIGALFAGGHSTMVLAISALVGMLGSRFTSGGGAIERIGTWISIVVLLAIAGLNLIALRSEDRDGSIRGVKSRLIPRALRTSANPLVAVPVGLLFGFGFETSSQVATYALAFGAGGGLAAALLIGVMFCAGMLVTDTLDSVLVHRLLVSGAHRRRAVTRTWAWTVTVMALVVAAVELAGVAGIELPLTDLQVSGALCAALILVFTFVFVRTRSDASASTLSTALPLGE